ncbi:extracellular solute-binding protein [Paenibacillus sp. WQ 127069]|uniref:Extracellular solute-binding protein n=1 Tax=Paenibacillus baimaensis TaxID=2982185 RepID=A0ABT2UHN6_9BACL|nr:extracellular solute-binding protein [Paenibacillus sp. WQ 127069]MCU6794162.1 extracellular solute-binding protein [Paenibacillus sp. WQ 127069]
MQKGKKGYVGAGCAVALLGGLLAGCGETAKPAEVAKPAETAKPAEAAKPADSGQNAKPLVLSWMRYEHPSQALVSDSQAVQEILKKKNVKLELQSTPQSNYDDKKKTLIATNSIPDVIMVKQDDLSNFADSGIFLDLTPYLEKMPNFKKILQEHPEINKNKFDGKLFGFPLVQKWAVQAGQVPMIRVDLLTKLNLKAPTTYEELYTVLKKFKEAYPDTFPFTSRAANGLTGTENLLNPIAFGFGSGYTNINGTKVYYDPKLKQYKFGPAMPEFKDAVTYLHKLYKEKLLDPDYATATSQIWQEKLSSGKSLFFQDNNGFATNFNLALQKKEPEAKFDLLPTMESDKGVKRNAVYQLDHLGESYAISAKIKNPDQVIQFIDWMYSDEGMKLTSWGVENTDYTFANNVYKISDATLNKFKDKPDPYRAMASALGLGYLGMGLYADDNPSIASQPKEFLEWGDKNLKALTDGLAFRQSFDPPFNKDEREKLKQLRTQLDAFMTQNMDKYIMTDGALNDWDNFIKQCKDKGASDIEKIYNDALARVK